MLKLEEGPPPFFGGFLVFFSTWSNISDFNLVRIVYILCMLFWLLYFFTFFTVQVDGYPNLFGKTLPFIKQRLHY